MNRPIKAVRQFLHVSSKSTVFGLLVGSSIVLFLFFLALFPEFVATRDPYALSSEILQAPSTEHIFGTDIIGRDVFSRVVGGTRISISIAAISVALSASIGSLLAVISGYIGGKLDQLLVVIIDSVYTFPPFILALIISTMLGQGNFVNVAIAVAISTIPSYFRINRSVTLIIKEKAFIEVERSIGASELYIVFRHILPRCLPSIVTLASLGLANAVLTVAGLGFLGLGVQPPTPEWGADLNYARRVLISGSWWPSVFPGIMIFVAALAFNLLGEGLTEVLSPEIKESKEIKP